MFTLKHFCIVSLALLMASTPSSAELLVQEDKQLIEVGRGEMSWLWFSLYRAKLFTPSGYYQSNAYPLTLDIEYYRDIESSHLIEATVEQWQHLGIKKEVLAIWESQLDSLWPNVTKGDHLSFDINQGGVGQFWFNGKPLAKQFNAEFSQSFIDIWLAPHTSRPQLRSQLIGEQACDC